MPRYHETRNPSTDELTTVQFTAEEEATYDEYDLQNIREKRDALLKNTDWWGASDRTMTTAQTNYRQALRDLPANTVDVANPVFPTEPT